MLNKINLTLNIILLLAVGYLFIQNNSDNSTNNQDSIIVDGKKNKIFDQKTLPTTDIVCLNTDSLLANYEYAVQLNKEFLSDYDDKKNRLDEQQYNLEQKIMDFQKRVSQMGQYEIQLKQEELMKEEQQLLQKREELMRLSQELTYELQNKNAKLTNDLFDTITAFLRKYKIDKNYQYIIGYSKNSGLFIPNDSLDITDDIVTGLNQAYQNRSK